MKRGINLMEKYFIECIEQAEVKKNMSLVIQGNGLKHNSKETKKDLDLLQKQYLDLEEKRRNWIPQIHDFHPSNSTPSIFYGSNLFYLYVIIMLLASLRVNPLSVNA